MYINNRNINAVSTDEGRDLPVALLLIFRADYWAACHHGRLCVSVLRKFDHGSMYFPFSLVQSLLIMHKVFVFHHLSIALKRHKITSST